VNEMSATTTDLAYRRVLLKLSGEALMGPLDYGVHMPTCIRFANELAEARQMGAEISLVIGGGNIFRGVAGAAQGMERAQADAMGMLATVINAIPMNEICEPFIRRRAMRHMEKGRVVIFAAGTGNPFFTTDTGAALRAAELNCHALLKGTQVDGVYSADPKTDASATRFDTLNYQDVLARDLRVMDASAVSLMRDNSIPIVVFSLHDKGSLQAVLRGEGTRTVISSQGTE